MEHQLTGGEGAGAYAGEGALPVKSSGAHFHAQRWFWNQASGWGRLYSSPKLPKV